MTNPIVARPGRTRLAAVALVAAAVLSSSNDCAGVEPSGKVLAKGSGTSGYYLVIRVASGQRERVDVGRTAWQRCSVGERYPGCASGQGSLR